MTRNTHCRLLSAFGAHGGISSSCCAQFPPEPSHGSSLAASEGDHDAISTCSKVKSHVALSLRTFFTLGPRIYQRAKSTANEACIMAQRISRYWGTFPFTHPSYSSRSPSVLSPLQLSSLRTGCSREPDALPVEEVSMARLPSSALRLLLSVHTPYPHVQIPLRSLFTALSQHSRLPGKPTPGGSVTVF